MRPRKALARCLWSLAGRGVQADRQPYCQPYLPIVHDQGADVQGADIQGTDGEPNGKPDHLAHIDAHCEPDGEPERVAHCEPDGKPNDQSHCLPASRVLCEWQVHDLPCGPVAAERQQLEAVPTVRSRQHVLQGRGTELQQLRSSQLHNRRRCNYAHQLQGVPRRLCVQRNVDHYTLYRGHLCCVRGDLAHLPPVRAEVS